MSGRMSRRSFLKGAVGTGLVLTVPQGIAGCGDDGEFIGRHTSGEAFAGPVRFHRFPSPQLPDAQQPGRTRGRDGDWLMPHLMRFLGESTLFADARGYLPAATDMNHLNAVAGTSSAQTGVVSVSVQPYNWNPDGTMRIEPIHVAWFRDDQGRPVDTLFNAWKRRWPQSRTAYIAGKFWVGEMFRSPVSDVDIIVTGGNHPGYVREPEVTELLRSTRRPRCSNRSGVPLPGVRRQGDPDERSLPISLPIDWIVDATLEVLEREKPDLGVILLAQMDDAQHSFGTVSDPDEFVACETLPCGHRSTRHPLTYREPILDAVRDVDNEFGRLLEGLRGLQKYREATVVLYSDHGHINHLFQEDFGKSTDMVEILYREGLITDEEKRGIGFAALGVSSVGGIWWKGDNRRGKAGEGIGRREALLRHEVVNPQTGERECPWYVGAHEDMIQGLPGYAEPGELWHDYYGPRNDRRIPLVAGPGSGREERLAGPRLRWCAGKHRDPASRLVPSAHPVPWRAWFGDTPIVGAGLWGKVMLRNTISVLLEMLRTDRGGTQTWRNMVSP